MSVEPLKHMVRDNKEAVNGEKEPLHKVFVQGRADSPTEAEIEDYKKVHPRTKIIILIKKPYIKCTEFIK